jgi:threonine dehydratase
MPGAQSVLCGVLWKTLYFNTSTTHLTIPVLMAGPEKESNMKRLEGKVAVVTGGNSGIGSATAKRLQEEGARVAISGRSRQELDDAVRMIGNDVVAVQADVARPKEMEKLYAEVKKKARQN